MPSFWTIFATIHFNQTASKQMTVLHAKIEGTNQTALREIRVLPERRLPPPGVEKSASMGRK